MTDHHRYDDRHSLVTAGIRLYSGVDLAARLLSGHHTLDGERQRLERGSRLSSRHWAVIALALILTIAAWLTAQSVESARAQQRFNSEAGLVVDQFITRLQRYSDLLKTSPENALSSTKVASIDSSGPDTEPRDAINQISAINGVTVVSAVMAEALNSEVLNLSHRLVQVSIADGDETFIDGRAHNTANIDPMPMFRDIQSVSLFGREWTFTRQSTLAFRETVATSIPTLVLISGLIINLLLVLLIVNHVRGRRETLDFTDCATRQLEKRAQALEQANDELNEFAQTVSHDLKSPLQGIRMLADYIEEEIDEGTQLDGVRAPVKHDLGRIRQQVAHSNTLIEGILDYSGVDAREESVELVNTQAMVREIGEILQLPRDALQILGALPELLTTRTRLSQVFTNLIGNAFKYHDDPANALVTVGATSMGEYVQFSVSDNGPGIDPKNHERVLKPFETLQSADDISSSGVGLAIVKKSVEHFGGQLSISSQTGQGAAFNFDWPINIAHDDDNSVVAGIH